MSETSGSGTTFMGGNGLVVHSKSVINGWVGS
jgi:hypothetical protein